LRGTACHTTGNRLTQWHESLKCKAWAKIDVTQQTDLKDFLNE